MANRDLQHSEDEHSNASTSAGYVPWQPFVTGVEEEEESQPTTVEDITRAKALRNSLRPGVASVWDGFLLTLLGLIMPIVGLVFAAALLKPNLPIALVSGGGLAVLLKIFQLANSLEYTTAALQLAEYDKKWVGALAEALGSVEPGMRSIARTVLTRLLPTLTPEDASLLNGHQRACLARSLNLRASARDEEYQIAALWALGRMGDDHTVLYVENLAVGFAWTARQRRLRGAAKQCLHTLEERLEQARAAQEVAKPTLSAEEEQPAVVIEMPPAMRKELDLLAEERRKHQQPGMRTVFLFAALMVIYPYTGYLAVKLLSEAQWATGGMWAMFSFLSTQLYRLTLSSKQVKAARKLAHFDDVRAVGPFAEMLEWPEPTITRIASNALFHLLPRLRASDAPLLNTKQRAILYGFLKMNNARSEADLMSSILTALEQVGDKDAVPVVEGLATSPATTRQQSLIREQAKRCLQFLHERAEQNTYSQELLRASSASEVGVASEILLRPASAAPATAPEQLLRPSQE